MSSGNAHRTCSTASRKRRERDGGAAEPPPPPPPPPPQSGGVGRPEPGSNRLLAGYLAHEFLTHGTLFGQKWDPAPAEATPLAAPPDPNSAGAKKAKARGADAASPTRARPHAYADVARLLKTQGAHVSGIVNPSELARWLQI